MGAERLAHLILNNYSSKLAATTTATTTASIPWDHLKTKPRLLRSSFRHLFVLLWSSKYAQHPDTRCRKCLGRPSIEQPTTAWTISTCDHNLFLRHSGAICKTQFDVDLAALHDCSSPPNAVTVRGSGNPSIEVTSKASSFDAAKIDSLHSTCTASQTSALFPIAVSHATQDLAPCGHSRAVIGRLQASVRLAAYSQRVFPAPVLSPAGSNVDIDS